MTRPAGSRRSARALGAALAYSAAIFSVAANATPRTAATIRLEAGTGVDTNPERLESNDDGRIVGQTAAVQSLAARLALAVMPAERTTMRLTALGAAKKFFGGAEAEKADTAVASGDARLDARLIGNSMLVGARLSAYDVFEREAALGAGDRNLARDFRTTDASFSLTLPSQATDRVQASFGYRWFHYKPAPDLDFDGEHAGLVYTRVFTLGNDEDRSIDLAVEYGVSHRRYDTRARAQLCDLDSFVGQPCQAMTALSRSDLFHQAAVEVTYTGIHILGARYDLHVNDSNSFGDGLVRHRVQLSATQELWWDVILTAKVALQWTQFLDPLLVSGDVGTFVTVEDEGRNALLLHATRDFGASWVLEARYAYAGNEFSPGALRFRRQVATLGLVYTFPANR